MTQYVALDTINDNAYGPFESAELAVIAIQCSDFMLEEMGEDFGFIEDAEQVREELEGVGWRFVLLQSVSAE